MNVYDFDKTIFYPDSSVTFCLYCLRRYPRILLPSMLKGLWGFARTALHLGTLKQAKEAAFSFLPRMKNTEEVLETYWNEKWDHVQDWYLRQSRPSDLIISASPEFEVRPAARRLGVRLLATPMDIHTGKINGNNCSGEEKVRRFREAFPDAEVDSFYSDSLRDTPMARLAKKAFLVRKGTLQPWPEKALRDK